MSTRVINGDCLVHLRTLLAGRVQCVVTSPPYFGLRDYGVEGQIGLEHTPEAYVTKLVEVFREVRRVLRDDGTLWLNLGDSYNAYNGNRGRSTSFQSATEDEMPHIPQGAGLTVKALGNKQMIGIPWRVAFALQADGWYLRSDIIWHKPNPMPESVTDRPTKAHEYLFLLSKQERYYYDAEAISEPVSENTLKRHSGPLEEPTYQARMTDTYGGRPHRGTLNVAGGVSPDDTRNKHTVWTVPTKPYNGAHFATFPPALIEPCILAGSRPGDSVLDPFGGAGTTGLVADRLGRDSILIELNPDYALMAEHRIHDDSPLFAEIVA